MKKKNKNHLKKLDFFKHLCYFKIKLLTKTLSDLEQKTFLKFNLPFANENLKKPLASEKMTQGLYNGFLEVLKHNYGRFYMENLVNLDLKAVLEIAKERAKDVPSGVSFKVRDLFVGYQWDQLDVGLRKKLGIYFFVWVDSSATDILEPAKDKSSSGQQLYTKK